MLGEKIREFRYKRKMSLEDLARKISCPVGTLNDIENGKIKQCDNRFLLKIIDALQIKKPYDFVYLVNLNKYPRRFQAYNVSLMRTGTASIASIFANYRHKHEFMISLAYDLLRKYERKEISEREFREFLIWRDSHGNLEMDSSNTNHYYLDFLKKNFTLAKFIFVIRDCYSWVDSLLNWIIHNDSWGRYDYFFGIEGLPSVDEKYVMDNFPDLIDRLILFWSESNKKIINALPRKRSLILKIDEINSRISEMADFVGVPEKTLCKDKAWKNRARHKVSFLSRFDPGFLDVKFNKHCRDLMNDFYPDYSLQNFHSGNTTKP
jgi:transcriptional regulator with XRE-family HTH domain